MESLVAYRLGCYYHNKRDNAKIRNWFSRSDTSLGYYQLAWIENHKKNNDAEVTRLLEKSKEKAKTEGRPFPALYLFLANYERERGATEEKVFPYLQLAEEQEKQLKEMFKKNPQLETKPFWAELKNDSRDKLISLGMGNYYLHFALKGQDVKTNLPLAIEKYKVSDTPHSLFNIGLAYLIDSPLYAPQKAVEYFFQSGRPKGFLQVAHLHKTGKIAPTPSNVGYWGKLDELKKLFKKSLRNVRWHNKAALQGEWALCIDENLDLAEIYFQEALNGNKNILPRDKELYESSLQDISEKRLLLSNQNKLLKLELLAQENSNRNLPSETSFVQNSNNYQPQEELVTKQDQTIPEASRSEGKQDIDITPPTINAGQVKKQKTKPNNNVSSKKDLGSKNSKIDFLTLSKGDEKKDVILDFADITLESAFEAEIDMQVAEGKVKNSKLKELWDDALESIECGNLLKGTGQPEILKNTSNISGTIVSRRINKEDRLVYSVESDPQNPDKVKVTILSIEGHYTFLTKK
ncbi:Txe/YoeB family addiction module toxin [Candidatus Bealeia paramacronuclearis]|uniref:Txe/YoeB family addiction module toxin n=1 Tax=Candidatus Bealeia paramacronuclearis TaxID=1921001 RepID=A0ABZ2C5D1_9PROT|nr:Txe/YoeB family addiction module toxin [Candidatus Bealeia paramacronuclearis]